MTPLLNDITAVAQRCGIDLPTALRWLRDGQLPEPIQVDGLVRWTEPTLTDWVAQGCPAGDPPRNTLFYRVRLELSEKACPAGDQ